MSQIDMSVSQLQSSVKIPYPEPIDLKLPNPFTQRPIATKWSSNELILTDPLMRVASRSSIYSGHWVEGWFKVYFATTS